MPSADTELALQADEEAVLDYLNEGDGLLFREVSSPGVYWLILRPASTPDEKYYVRLVWTVYPDEPPSVKFYDQIDGRNDVPHAWPNAPGYRINSWDICKPFTAEGFGIHPDWRNGPTAWRSTGNPFLYVVETLQNDLNNDKYQGRH
jgi:hypothetical protein